VTRLLAFSDLHNSRRHARRLVDLAADADVVVGAGDFASLRLGLGRTLDSLAAIDAPFVLVPGNNESDTALWRCSDRIRRPHILHGEGKRICGIDFYGLGGAVPPAPMPWSWNLSEEDAAARLAGCTRGGVLVAHSPPHGQLDRAGARHLGSHSVRAAIERCRPILTLCGHIHQCHGGEAWIGETRVVNLGPAGAFFDL
jgi:Icc-related predicted phosphoesterase